jgi:hypothetical protein
MRRALLGEADPAPDARSTPPTPIADTPLGGVSK